MSYQAHLFICTHQRETGASCGQRGAAELRDALKAKGKDASKDWKGKVRINNSGCLGRCEEGIAAVLYPQGKWLTELKPEDSNQLEKIVDDALLETQD